MTWNDRAQTILSQGCNTYSKRADQNIEGVSPTHCTGVEVPGHPGFQGADGKLYADFSCGLGSNLIRFRNNFSIPSTKEVELAERLKGLFPCIEKVKILKTGSAACEAAIRFARAWQEPKENDRKAVIGTGYHGCSNAFIADEDPGSGAIHEGYYKLNSLKDIFRDIHDDMMYDVNDCIREIAAVIVEPIQLDAGVEDQLREIRQVCTEKNIVLIFDEVISGFRVPKYSFANYFGIQPDLIVLGKALGDGYPIAVLGGRADILETPGVFISNTHNGEVSAINAALETLDYLTEDKLQALWDLGAWFQKEFNAISPKVQIVGYPTRGELRGEDLPRALFIQEMAKTGINWGRPFFMHFMHTREFLEYVLALSRQLLHAIEGGQVTLEGKMPRPIFQRN